MCTLLLQAGVPNSVRQTVSKLVECGFLFSRVRKFVDLHGADRASGLVVQVRSLRFTYVLLLLPVVLYLCT